MVLSVDELVALAILGEEEVVLEGQLGALQNGYDGGKDHMANATADQAEQRQCIGTDYAVRSGCWPWRRCLVGPSASLRAVRLNVRSAASGTAASAFASGNWL